MMYSDIKKHLISDMNINVSRLEFNAIKYDDIIVNNIKCGYNIYVDIADLHEILNDDRNFLNYTNYEVVSNIVNGKYIGNVSKQSYMKSTYFIDIDKYYINEKDLISYIHNPKNRLRINIHGILEIENDNGIKFSNLSNIGYIINRYIKKDQFPNIELNYNDTEINNYKDIFSKKTNLYTSISDDIYSYNKFYKDINGYITSLATNMSISLYRNISFPGNIIRLDIDDGNILIGNMKLGEFKKLYNQVAEEGIQNPLLINIDAGLMYPLLIEDVILLVIARSLSLPSIPVILYTSDTIIDDYMEHHKYSDIQKKCSSIFYLKEELEPFILIEKSDKIKDGVICIKDNVYDLNRYDLVSNNKNINYSTYILNDTSSKKIDTNGSYDISEDIISQLIGVIESYD